MMSFARIFFAVILGAVLGAGLGRAQEEGNVNTATSALQSVLSNLKQSVEQLSLDNDQLAARDRAIKQQVRELKDQLGALESQGELLDKAAGQLQDKNPHRSEQIARLEEENYELDDRTQKTENSIQQIQQSLEAGYREDQRLLLQLKRMTNSMPGLPEAQPADSQAAVRLQKEKLRLMKMIYDSQKRQGALHESILEFQKNTPLLPGASALAHQQLLKEQIKDLETQLSAYPPRRMTAVPAEQLDDTQLHQLELELKALEKNYLQLKDLMGQMTKKSQNAQGTIGDRAEAEKLQKNIDDLNHQGAGLRAGLDDLRSQMIDLDKRKSQLEDMIKKMD
jgi:chromosome segregation ATPase